MRLSVPSVPFRDGYGYGGERTLVGNSGRNSRRTGEISHMERWNMKSALIAALLILASLLPVTE